MSPLLDRHTPFFGFQLPRLAATRRGARWRPRSSTRTSRCVPALVYFFTLVGSFPSRDRQGAVASRAVQTTRTPFHPLRRFRSTTLERSCGTSLPVRLAIAVVLCYQGLVRPLLSGSCKYWPTCSAYCVEAFQTHGLITALRMTIGRLCRCHPFAMGGYDPVPECGGNANSNE